ncbi:hypothetical protein P308_30050 [Pseudomonas piscis]|nr:hypothetical protein P308_30050 [Pseudomonas piscis]
MPHQLTMSPSILVLTTLSSIMTGLVFQDASGIKSLFLTEPPPLREHIWPFSAASPGRWR